MYLCHVENVRSGQGGVYALEIVKIGHFEEFQGINAPPDPTEYFQQAIYTYIYVYILYI